MELEERMAKAAEAVHKAGIFIKDFQRRYDLRVEFKGDDSPVTLADRESQKLIMDILLGAFPNDGFIGEEKTDGLCDGTNGYLWTCDPIDGTWSFINHEKTASVSLGLYKDDKVVLGAIYNPFTDELFQGCDGQPVTLNGQELPVVNISSLSKSVLNFQISCSYGKDVHTLYELWEKDVISKVISQGGSAAYNLAQVAHGSNSAYVVRMYKQANSWDIAAGVYLVRGVGGKVTDLSGRDVEEDNASNVLIATTNLYIHDELLETLNTTDFGK